MASVVLRHSTGRSIGVKVGGGRSLEAESRGRVRPCRVVVLVPIMGSVLFWVCSAVW